MNEFTYYCLASVEDGTGDDLWAWSGNIEKGRHRPLEDTRSWLLRRLQQLLEGDLVAVGNFEDGDSGRAVWRPWTGDPESLVERIAAIYTVDVEPDEVQFWDCYLMRTEHGSEMYTRERTRRLSAGRDTLPRLRNVWDADGNVIEPRGDEIAV
ncbi:MULTISPECIES: hypothetical protein [Curtobacterium]|jgi:hypothetical protein|uniref:Uncharacterized protein n=1 Tax=Curtobacterium citri TaxID=3055139 RepID=A0ABT7T3J1_9MICO|nr:MULTISPECIES: hypothetical protein [Curtobacterium]MDM7884135.1 hypothetical protein [Curtobacterium citri]